MSEFHNRRRDDQQSNAVDRAEHESPASVDPPRAEWFCRAVAQGAEVAAKAAGVSGGQLVLSSFGELSVAGDAVNWCKITPRNLGFDLGEWAAMAAQAVAWAEEPGRNVYLSLALYPSGLSRNKRGKASDTLGVFGLGADLDGDKGCKTRVQDLPLPPTIVISSSQYPADNFNLLWLFKSLVTVEEARPLARALADVVGDTDGGTADPTHVWRVPGTLNWPKKSKIARGRPRTPQPVRLDCRGLAT